MSDEEEYDTDDSAVLAALDSVDFERYWYTEPPAPNFVHPFYAAHRSLISQWLDNGLFWENPDTPSQMLLVPTPHLAPTRSGPGEELEFPHTLLRREPRALGLCPFAGEPALYWWWTATDRHGWQVAGALHREEVDYQAVTMARGKARFIIP